MDTTGARSCRSRGSCPFPRRSERLSPAHRLHRKYLRRMRTWDLLCALHLRHECGAGKTLMTAYSYILFNKSLEQARHLGARGGRTYARNQRARRARLPIPPPVAPPRRVPRETAAEAILALDAQFPWLLGVSAGLSPWPTGVPAAGSPRRRRARDESGGTSQLSQQKPRRQPRSRVTS